MCSSSRPGSGAPTAGMATPLCGSVGAGSITGVALPKTTGKVLVHRVAAACCQDPSARDSGYCRNFRNIGNGSWQLGVTRAQKGLEAVQQARLVWRRNGADQLADPIFGAARHGCHPSKHRDPQTERQHPERAWPVFWRQALEEVVRARDDEIEQRGVAAVMMRGLILENWGSSRLRIRTE
jgi:hypothetical protein